MPLRAQPSCDRRLAGTLPRELVADAIAPVTKIANDVYRRTVARPQSSNGHLTGGRTRSLSSAVIRGAVGTLLAVASADERRIIRRVAARLRSH